MLLIVGCNVPRKESRDRQEKTDGASQVAHGAQVVTDLEMTAERNEKRLRSGFLTIRRTSHNEINEPIVEFRVVRSQNWVTL